MGKLQKRNLARILLVALPAIALLLLTACGKEMPQNTFATEGEVAQRQRELFDLALWPAIVIMVVVEAALIVAVILFRQRAGQKLPKQVHGNTRLEIAWTLAPAALLLGLAVPMIALIADLAAAPPADSLKVKVIGHQWVWEFQYPDIKDDQGRPLTVFGTPDRPAVLHIPVNRIIDATITSADVIHSFWVPRLAGKVDAIPGKENKMWFNATSVGSYAGQCAEFCGLRHANMTLVVMAETEQEFDAWVEQTRAAAKPGSGAQVTRGE